MFTSRQVTIAGLLVAITVVLGLTGIGFIPFRTLAGRATIMHIPVILASMIEGPGVGMMVGFMFGLFSFLRAASPRPADPVVAFLPRLLIGITAWGAFQPFANRQRWITGGAVAGITGTLTNTAGVLVLALWRRYLPDWSVTLMIALTHGIPEVIVAGISVPVIYRTVIWQERKGTR